MLIDSDQNIDRLDLPEIGCERNPAAQNGTGFSLVFILEVFDWLHKKRGRGFPRPPLYHTPLSGGDVLNCRKGFGVAYCNIDILIHGNAGCASV